VVVPVHAVHPFDCVLHVCTPPSEHCVAAPPSARFAHVLVQHEAAPASPPQSPFVHVCELAWKRQLFESSWHVSSVVPPFVQSVPVAVHAVALHEHAPDPGAPVHDWCGPQPSGVPLTFRHPFASATHVASVVPFSQTLPAVPLQLGSLLQVHEAEPAAPVHTWSD
jgi:hypothetical protein